MRILKISSLALLALLPAAAEDGFTSLFNGSNLDGWRVNENPSSFLVQDGAIVAHGPRSHCFYVGDFAKHAFRNFEL
jgi:Domain of Unknown Function (DUF1080)